MILRGVDATHHDTALIPVPQPAPMSMATGQDTPLSRQKHRVELA